MNESPATQTDEPAVSRWAGWGEVLRRMLVGTAAAAVAVGLLGAVVAWGAGRGVSSTIAAAYYIIGCLLFLIGMFPSGGFSMVRGTLTRRRPTGARQEPIFLLGLVLIALGVVVDVFF
jgi:hypothetical protein